MRDAFQRPFTIATAVVFIISSAFPVVAAFVKDTQSWPRWWGAVDVGLAFVLAVMVFVIQAVARNRVDREAKEASYRAYRILIHGLFAIMVVFVLAGDRIIWSQCLTGFGWRAWLLLYALPEWFAAFKL